MASTAVVSGELLFCSDFSYSVVLETIGGELDGMHHLGFRPSWFSLAFRRVVTTVSLLLSSCLLPCSFYLIILSR